MEDYIFVNNEDGDVGITFYIEQDKILAIGEKMNAICDDAYMNGYNWEAFLNYYLEKNAPEVLEGLESDPEAGMYSAYYEDAPDSLEKAEEFAGIIKSLIENEDKLYEFLRKEADNIEWD